MYQGSNVHYSPVDHKPLCSYSAKICKQRRLNGYAFCVRHILEDPTAPFKQCEYVVNAKTGPQRCTNAIPNDKERQFCNSHMQVMGIIPKKERKNKSKEKLTTMDMDATFSLESRLKSRFSLTRTNSKFADKSISDPDDPYAFPDTEPAPVQSSYSPGHAGISNSEFGQGLSKPDMSFSAAKMFPELAEKLERAKSKPEPKMKGAKSGRTMNRLQTRIAQNKIKDKLKRNQEFSSQGTTPEYQPSTPQTPVSQPFCVDNSQRFYFENRTKPSFGGQPLLNNFNGPLLGNSLGSNSSSNFSGSHLGNSLSKSLQLSHSSAAGSGAAHRQTSIPRSHSRFRKHSDILSEAEVRKRLKRDSAVSVYRYHAMKKAYNTDLLTFAPDDSDSDSDQDLLPWQPTWFSVSSDEDESEEQDESSHSSRMVNLSLFKTRLRRQFNQLRKSQLANVTMRLYDSSASQSLAKATKESSSCAHKAILEINKKDVRKNAKIDKLKRRCLKQRPCLYKNEEESVTCSNTALPYTNHCTKHILYNVDQQLFDYCTGKCAQNNQCCTPVFDVLHEYPVCHAHSSQAVAIDVLSEIPVKRPRKKPKPLALLRPAKKKKKNNRKIRPQKPMPPLEPSGDTTMPVTPTMDTTPSSILEFSTRETNNLGSRHEENDLSPGAIDKSLELPLDGASKLLEDHELNDVLNKLPAEAFNELFSGKNGGTDETSELEQALAANFSKETLEAITKDVMMDNDETDEGELPNHIADAILQQEEDMNNLNNLTSSFSSHDFKAMSQTFNGPLASALGNITTESLQQFIGQGSVPGSQQAAYGQTTYTSAPTIQALLQRPPMGMDHHGYGNNESGLHHAVQHQYANSMTGSQQFVNNVNASPQRPSLHIPQHVNSPLNCHSPGGHTPSPHAATSSPLSHHSPHHVQSPMPSPIPNYRPTWPLPNDRAAIPATYQNGYPTNLPPYPQGSIKYQYPDGTYPPMNSPSPYPAGTGIQYPGYDVRTSQLPHYAGLPPTNS